MTTASLRQCSLTCSAVLALGTTASAATFTESFDTVSPTLPSEFTLEATAGLDENDVVSITDSDGDARIAARLGVDNRETAVAYINTATAALATNTVITADIGKADSSSNPGLIARFNPGATSSFADSSGYGFFIDDATTPRIELYAIVGGSFDLLASTNIGTARASNSEGFYTVSFSVTDDGSGGVDLAVEVVDDDASLTGTATLTFNDTTPIAANGTFGLLFDADGSAREGYYDNLAVTFDAVPEPASLALVGLGSLLIAGRRRRG